MFLLATANQDLFHFRSRSRVTSYCLNQHFLPKKAGFVDIISLEVGFLMLVCLYRQSKYQQQLQTVKKTLKAWGENEDNCFVYFTVNICSFTVYAQMQKFILFYSCSTSCSSISSGLFTKYFSLWKQKKNGKVNSKTLNASACRAESV